MKKQKNLYKTAFFAAIFAVLSFGCSNLSDSEDETVKSGMAEAFPEKSVLAISFSKKPAARFIKAADFDLSKVESWALTYTDENDKNATPSTLNSLAPNSQANKASLSYSDNILTAAYIPTGTYTIVIEGIYTDESSKTITIAGSTSGIKIAQGERTSATIAVGLAKTESGKGSLELALQYSKDLLDTASVIVSLKNIDDTKTDYSYSSAENKTFSFESSGNAIFTLKTLDSISLESGWYILSISCPGLKLKLDDSIIEIADGIKTTGTLTISIPTEKEYYAANDSAANGNGFSAYSRANLSALLEDFTSTLPDEEYINIHVDSEPELEIDILNSLTEKLKTENTSKTISIYGPASSTNASFYISATEQQGASTQATVKSDITSSLTLAASGDSKILEVSTVSISESASVSLTLKGGAALKITGEMSQAIISGENQAPALIIHAVTTDGTADNLASYTSASPFITIENQASTDITQYIQLYEYGENDVSTKYEVTRSENNEYYVSQKTSS